jgi:Kef-type K+ transport system membrane component KefB
MLRPGLTPEQVLGFVLLDIAIILLAARLLGRLANKVGQPTVVGEIVAGILLGPSLLGATIFTWTNSWSFLNCEAALSAQIPGTPIPPDGTPPPAESITACLFPPQARGVLGIIGQLALVFFMFLVGLELDWKLLKGKGKSIALVSFGAVAVPIALAFAIGPVLYAADFVPFFDTPAAPSQTSFTLFIAGMLAVTAFPVMARILQEKQLTASPMGSTGVAAAAVVTVLMFLTVAVAAGVATDQGPSRLAVKFLVAAVYIAVLFVVARPALVPLGRSYERAGQLTPLTFGIIMVFTFASAYAAHQIGINVIVGAFLAGAVLPAREGLFRELAGRLSDVTAVILLPIFLAFSGLNTDFTKLSISHVPTILLFLAAGIIGKWAGSAVFARLGGLSWAEGNVLGVLMNCRGLLVLVVALIALNQGVITPPMQVAGVLMALVTTIMTGPLVDRFLPTVPGGAQPVGPAPSGTTRILAVAGTIEEAAPVADVAFRMAGGGPTEVVLFRPIPLSPYDELPNGLGDELVEAEHSMRALKLLGTLAPENATVQPVTYGAVDGAAAAIELATEGTDLIVVAAADDSPISLAHRIVERAPCPVVVCPVDTSPRPEGPVVLVGTDEHASDVADRHDDAVERRGGDEDVTDARFVIVGAFEREALDDVVTARSALVLTVHPPARVAVSSAPSEEPSTT